MSAYIHRIFKLKFNWGVKLEFKNLVPNQHPGRASGYSHQHTGKAMNRDVVSLFAMQ